MGQNLIQRCILINSCQQGNGAYHRDIHIAARKLSCGNQQIKIIRLGFHLQKLALTDTGIPLSSHFSLILVATTVDVAIPFPHATNIRFIFIFSFDSLF